MPELPEVEVFRRFVTDHTLKRKIEACKIFHPKILEGVTPEALVSAVNGRRFTETLRRGKNLFIRLDGKPSLWVYMHFGMTGYLSWFTKDVNIVNAYGDPKRKHDFIRVQFDFEGGGHLAFHEQRMFGKLGLVEDPEAAIAKRKLGLDALDADAKTFTEGIRKRKGQIKPVLMDQSLVAGIGNVYADEMLFQCKLHPERRTADLSDADVTCLYKQMYDVLQKTVDANADRDQLPKAYLLHQRRKQGLCPRDKEPLAIREIGGRTTYFCPKCQK